jgi:8-oxo-dGTP diphosphatase
MKPNFCLTCAQPLTAQNDTDYTCANGHTYWNGPHCGTSIVFIQNGQVLTVKRNSEPHKGRFSFPGGFANHQEQPWAAAIREAHEETGAVIEPEDLTLLDAQTKPYSADESTVTVIYLAKRWSGDLRAGDDAAELVWQPIDFLESQDFSWHYNGLTDKLRSIVAKTINT